MDDKIAAHWGTHYKFRAQRTGERDADYRHALLTHVQTRDLAAAHEIRVGRWQKDWTQADITAFLSHTKTLGGPSSQLTPGAHAYTFFEDPGPYPVTDAELIRLATAGIEVMMENRREDPERGLAVIASVLLTTGVVIHSAVSSGERLAFLKMMAKTHPVFGFFLVFDGWIHKVEILKEGGEQKATKIDALMAHIGSRDFRRTLVRTYRYLNDRTRVIFDNPPPPDITGDDFREHGNDPYTEVFLSVPDTHTVQ